MAESFKLYECDLGIKIDGVRYDFEHVVNVTYENPEQTRLTRGANAGNKVGLPYKEGIREPKKLTCTIIGMSIELAAVLNAVYENHTRVDFFCVSRIDGSSKMGKNAVLCQEPQQLNMDDTADSMNVALVFETFDITETRKN